MAVSGDVKIRAEDVLVRFGDIVALDRFSAEVPQGVVGLLGPNGAGKSTFIKVALGLLEAQEGKITIDGLDPRIETVLLRDKIGYMPENECLIQSHNAFELVSYMAQLSGLLPEEAMKRSHAVLDFTGFREERYRKISTYSTGMKQRVKLAQSIVHDLDYLHQLLLRVHQRGDLLLEHHRQRGDKASDADRDHRVPCGGADLRFLRRDTGSNVLFRVQERIWYLIALINLKENRSLLSVIKRRFQAVKSFSAL